MKSICMALPVTACHALPAFSHVFHCSPVIGAGLSDLVSIYPSSAGGLKWPPRAGLPRLRMQGMQIWLHQQLDFLEEKGEKDPDLKANPWSVVGTNGSKIELPLFG